ncbi:hypothetical protein [Streptomyces sp. NPDC055085]
MGTLNQGSRGTGVVGRSDYVGRTKWARAYYDFATDGGAVGAINLRGDKIPSGATVLSAHVVVPTGLLPTTTSTMSLGIEGAADLRAAAVVTTATGGKLDGSVGTALTSQTRATAPLALTADRHVVATIAAGTFSAGRFSVFVEYVESAAAV